MSHPSLTPAQISSTALPATADRPLSGASPAAAGPSPAGATPVAADPSLAGATQVPAAPLLLDIHPAGAHPPLANGPPPTWAGTIDHAPCGGSSMDLARAAPHAPHGHSWRLDQQTAGRGRRGRAWSSRHHLGLWMTTLLRPQRLDGLQTLPLLVGCSLLAVVQRMGVSAAALKWPNDIWVEGRKLAGILLEAETSGTCGPACRVWAGIGLNLASPPDEPLGIGLLDILTPPPLIGHDLRPQLAADISAQLAIDSAAWHQLGLAAVASRLAAHDALAGAQVCIIPGGGIAPWYGRAAGIAADGSLQVVTSEGAQSVIAGEVERVRPL